MTMTMMNDTRVTPKDSCGGQAMPVSVTRSPVPQGTQQERRRRMRKLAVGTFVALVVLTSVGCDEDTYRGWTHAQCVAMLGEEACNREIDNVQGGGQPPIDVPGWQPE